MVQLITAPTRCTADNQNLLVLIITHTPGYVLDAGILPPILTSDHSPVYCQFSFRTPHSKPYRRHYGLVSMD